VTEAELRSDIAAFDARLTIVQVRRLTADGDLEALVEDAWGQYRYPWLKTQRDPAPPGPAIMPAVSAKILVSAERSTPSPLPAVRTAKKQTPQLSLF
jgi:hypothetical protein